MTKHGLKKNGSNGNGILGATYEVWRKLQDGPNHGQHLIIRFGAHHDKFPGKLRRQSGHDHCASVVFFATDTMIQMRPYVPLDELTLTRAFELHDKPEGFRGKEVIAPLKKDEDDLEEYLAFKAVYGNLSKSVWREAQHCFLLQFCLTNPPCFPKEARRIMSRLAERWYHEALFFQGIQEIDYLFYAYECFHERGVRPVIEDVTRRQFGPIEEVAANLPGFKKVVWTPKRRAYFAQFLKDAPTQ